MDRRFADIKQGQTCFDSLHATNTLLESGTIASSTGLAHIFTLLRKASLSVSTIAIESSSRSATMASLPLGETLARLLPLPVGIVLITLR
jgi:hypothetical protein